MSAEASASQPVSVAGSQRPQPITQDAVQASWNGFLEKMKAVELSRSANSTDSMSQGLTDDDFTSRGSSHGGGRDRHTPVSFMSTSGNSSLLNSEFNSDQDQSSCTGTSSDSSYSREDLPELVTSSEYLSSLAVDDDNEAGHSRCEGDECTPNM